MMKVMLAAIEIFSLVYQRIFAQKVLTQRKHSRVWECFVWGMYFVISNFFTYSFAKSAWDNTGIFVVSFFFALRILYIVLHGFYRQLLLLWQLAEHYQKY